MPTGRTNSLHRKDVRLSENRIESARQILGVDTATAAHRLERLLFAPFEQRSRIIAPSYAAWKRAGRVLSVLARREGPELRHISKGFSNDVILAVTCREAGVVLVRSEDRA